MDIARSRHSGWSGGKTDRPAVSRRATNNLLLRHFAALALPQGARVLVPLCGPFSDIGGLMAQGYGVVGA